MNYSGFRDVLLSVLPPGEISLSPSAFHPRPTFQCRIRVSSPPSSLTALFLFSLSLLFAKPRLSELCRGSAQRASEPHVNYTRPRFIYSYTLMHARGDMRSFAKRNAGRGK